MSLTTFVYDDPRLASAELAARIYPDKSKRTAAQLVNRALKEKPDTPDGLNTLRAMQAQVQQLAADLREALTQPAAAGLVPMGLDTRLASQPIAERVFTSFTASTARTYWKAVRDGNKKLEYGQRIALRAALAELATACEEAAK